MGRLRLGRTGAGLFTLHRGGGRHAGGRSTPAAAAPPSPNVGAHRQQIPAPVIDAPDHASDHASDHAPDPAPDRAAVHRVVHPEPPRSSATPDMVQNAWSHQGNTDIEQLRPTGARLPAHPGSAVQPTRPALVGAPVLLVAGDAGPQIAVRLGFSDGSAVTLHEGDPWARALCGVADEITRRRPRRGSSL